VHLNVFCLICINLYYTWNYAKFAKRMDFAQFLTAVCAAKSKNEQCLLLWSRTLLEEGLLPDIRRLSKDDFLFQQDRAAAHRSHYTVAYLRSHVPEFIEL